MYSPTKNNNGQSSKKQEWTEYADQIIQPKPMCETRKGKNEIEGFAPYGIDDFIFSSPFVDIETCYAGK